MPRVGAPLDVQAAIHRAFQYVDRQVEAHKREALFKEPEQHDTSALAREDRQEAQAARARAKALESVTTDYRGYLNVAHLLAGGGSGHTLARPESLMEPAALGALARGASCTARWLPVFFDAAVERADVPAAEALVIAFGLLEKAAAVFAPPSASGAATATESGRPNLLRPGTRAVDALRQLMGPALADWHRGAGAVRASMTATLDAHAAPPVPPGSSGDPLLSRFEAWKAAKLAPSPSLAPEPPEPHGLILGRFEEAEAAAKAINRGVQHTQKAKSDYLERRAAQARDRIAHHAWTFRANHVRQTVAQIQAEHFGGFVTPEMVQASAALDHFLTLKVGETRSLDVDRAGRALVDAPFAQFGAALERGGTSRALVDELFHQDRDPFRPLITKLDRLRSALERSPLLSHDPVNSPPRSGPADASSLARAIQSMSLQSPGWPLGHVARG